MIQWGLIIVGWVTLILSPTIVLADENNKISNPNHLDNIPSVLEIMTRVEACSASRSEEVAADLEGGINRWRDGLVQGQYSSRSSAQFLESFSDENLRLEAFKIYTDCLKPWEPLSVLKIPPRPVIRQYLSQEKFGLYLALINGMKNGGHLDFIFRLQNLSSTPKRVYYGGISYTDNNGTICNKGNLMRKIRGISHKSNQKPTVIEPDEVIQFTDENIGCSTSSLSGIGAVDVSIDDGDANGNYKRHRFLILDATIKI